MHIIVRNAIADDYSTVCDLLDELDTLHRDNHPDIFQKTVGLARTQDYYLGLLNDGNIGLFLAETDGEPVGLIHVIIRDAPDFPIFVPRRYAVIDALVVKSRVRKHGVGNILMETAKYWAVMKGAASIELGVYEFNETAISFYKSLGFHTLSRKMEKDLDL